MLARGKSTQQTSNRHIKHKQAPTVDRLEVGDNQNNGQEGKEKEYYNSSSSAAASKAEKEQKRQARLSLVDEQGRMHREDGIRFYGLLDFIALSCIDAIEKERRVTPNIPPLNWPARDGLQKMPDAVRSIVMSYILRNIDRLSAEVDLGIHDELFLKCFSRSIEEKDKDDIRSWKNHLFDDFIVVDHISHKGTVLVQVGRVQQVEFNKLREKKSYIRQGVRMIFILREYLLFRGYRHQLKSSSCL